jgi:hypothetical protein
MDLHAYDDYPTLRVPRRRGARYFGGRCAIRLAPEAIREDGYDGAAREYAADEDAVTRARIESAIRGWRLGPGPHMRRQRAVRVARRRAARRVTRAIARGPDDDPLPPQAEGASAPGRPS